ncbi:MAG: GatB/YqeY domain-containing protein [Bacilli bacterium]
MLEKITNDIKKAMIAKDKITLEVLRSIKGEIKNKEIDKKESLSKEEIITVIMKAVKMRKESIAEFEKAGRNDLVELNQGELDILNLYLPKLMSNEEITTIVLDAKKESGAKVQKDMGLIMKIISPKVKGKADMALVSKIIKDNLE